MTLSELIATYQDDIPAKDVRLIVQTVLQISNTDFLLKKDSPLSDEETKILSAVLSERKNGIPVARLFQEWEFWGLPFHLSPETLVPRPDTETLIEAVLKSCPAPPQRILDLGTGSGCILIALLHEYPEAFGVGIDLSADALHTARRNAIRNNVFRRAAFVQADWTAPIDGTFDVIVSNPPYINTAVITSLQTEVKDHDPRLALDGGKDGLDAYRDLLKTIKSCMTSTTQVFFEIGFDQADDIKTMIEDAELSTGSFYYDLSGHRRVISFTHGDNNKKNESQG